MVHIKLVAIIPLILSIGIAPSLSFGYVIDSPRDQIQNGIAAKDVVCKSELALMIRNTGAAACVKPDSVNKLENRGWDLLKEATMTDEEEHFSIELEDGVGVIGP